MSDKYIPQRLEYLNLNIYLMKGRLILLSQIMHTEDRILNAIFKLPLTIAQF